MKKSLIIGVIIIAVIGAAIIFSSRVPILNKISDKSTAPTGVFTTDTSGLPEAKPTSVVELRDGDTYNLTASIVKKNIGGQTLKMLAYNGSTPGPAIKVPQGAEITLNFTNNTDVETTIHSHGVRLENKFDGVPDVTQKAVGVGESFTYKVKFPDEGMYWYHPHLREDYAQELGLYGNYWVVPSDPNYWSSVNREIPLFLDDILIESGKIAVFNKAFADHTLMGRFGNTLLVNGETEYTLNAKQGEVIRFYLTNAANTRTFNISIPGVRMKLVGGDSGKYEKETFVESLIMSPSERVVVEALFPKAGSYSLTHKTPERTYMLGTVSVSNEKAEKSFEKEFSDPRTNSDIVASTAPFRAYFEKSADKRVTLTIDMRGNQMMQGGQGQMSSGEPIEWEDTNATMNAMSNTQMVKWKIVDDVTGKEGEDIDWKFKVGDKVKIRIFNDPKSMHPMQHPIHIHGQRFLVLSANGEKNDNLVWKDTVLIPNGDTVELLIDMTNPGTWMAHCHIPEHLESGMMFSFDVAS